MKPGKGNSTESTGNNQSGSTKFGKFITGVKNCVKLVKLNPDGTVNVTDDQNDHWDRQ